MDTDFKQTKIMTNSFRRLQNNRSQGSNMYSSVLKYNFNRRGSLKVKVARTQPVHCLMKSTHTWTWREVCHCGAKRVTRKGWGQGLRTSLSSGIQPQRRTWALCSPSTKRQVTTSRANQSDTREFVICYTFSKLQICTMVS